MNKLEEEIYSILRGGKLPLKKREEVIKPLLELFQQTTLTLDSKIKDGEIVDEPDKKDFHVETARESGGEIEYPIVFREDYYNEECEEYQNLPTLRECLKELEELREDVKDLTLIVKRGNELLGHQEEQIEQLTKERDEWQRTSQNMAVTMTDLNNELQAEKSKTKELEELHQQGISIIEVQESELQTEKQKVKERDEYINALCAELEGTTKTQHTWNLVDSARKLLNQ